ncbi:MAG: hypothetical protein IRY99_04230, partial [Isosphaeraceae bacterium]|nr:hypothetical protein [Isosphaeraceae bacterium]
QPDRAAIARAEAALDAARRGGARAEARAAEGEARLAAAAAEQAAALGRSRTLGLRLRDPSARIASAKARGQRLKVERDRLARDLAVLQGTPKPRAKPLVDKSPVARPPDGEEFHFELRRGRVTFIDLERLLDRVRTDARLQVRLHNHRPGPIISTVGPIGAFSLQYELGRTLPEEIAEALEARGSMIYGLRSWEIVPEQDRRGEPYELAMQPASDFSRAVNRLRPSSDTITMWVYPDSFGLYRQLRDALHARGFLVAARPLPEGLPIRGSLSGSISAGQ